MLLGTISPRKRSNKVPIPIAIPTPILPNRLIVIEVITIENATSHAEKKAEQKNKNRSSSDRGNNESSKVFKKPQSWLALDYRNTCDSIAAIYWKPVTFNVKSG